jgi:PAS domain S-box-containing protein
MRETILLVLHPGSDCGDTLPEVLRSCGFRVGGVFHSVEEAKEKGRADYALVDTAVVGSSLFSPVLSSLAAECPLGAGCILSRDARPENSRTAAGAGATALLSPPFDDIQVRRALDIAIATGYSRLLNANPLPLAQIDLPDAASAFGNDETPCLTLSLVCANRPFTNLFGTDDRELLQKLLFGNDNVLSAGDLCALISGACPPERERDVHTAVGRVFPARIGWSFAGRGEPPGDTILLSITDLSRGRSGETSFESKCRHYETLFNAAPLGIALLDSSGTVLDVNDAFLRLFGFPSPAELCGKFLREKIAGGPVGLQSLALEQLVLQGKRVSVDTKRKRRDGTEIDVALVHAPVRLPSGATGIYCAYWDITDRKENENRLRRQLRREKLSSQIALSVMLSSYLEPVVTEALQHAGLFSDCDRACFVSLEAGPFGDPAAWTRRGIPDVEDDGNAHALRHEGWMWNRLRMDRFVVLEDLGVVAERGSMAMERLRERKIGGFFAAPVVLRGTVLGVFVLECIDRKKTWDSEEIGFMRFLSDLFSGMAERNLSKSALSEVRNRYHSVFMEFPFPFFLCSVHRERRGGAGDIRLSEWNGQGGKFLLERGFSDPAGRAIREMDPTLAEALDHVAESGGSAVLPLRSDPWGGGFFVGAFSHRKGAVAFVVFCSGESISM